ncbi:uncharacterized protein B0H18DRAFT_1121795 [Fomitopsis serialis]|uniref:uncharacterized protein n=1 Tax=Fomitopsis serialis TaxID=139415 RepID=UPI00200894C7|nr:uncharacterized protein B0H18DRAFT_1121795 [Neoantrodia serialis]KAH9920703.1 hypothetical protein B0H18DRAFT_1121795 [Neoantrodia serialis]
MKWFDVLDAGNRLVLTEQEVLRNPQAIVRDAEGLALHEPSSADGSVDISFEHAGAGGAREWAVATGMSAAQATSDLPGTDATFEAEVTAAGRILLSELNITLDSVIGYLNPTTRDCHADSDSDSDSDSDRRSVFILDWDLYVRDPVSPPPPQRDLMPASAFAYSSLYDSMDSHMLKYGGTYRGTIQVLLIKTVDVGDLIHFPASDSTDLMLLCFKLVGQPDLMAIKVYGDEPQDWCAEWCKDCNAEYAIVYFEWRLSPTADSPPPEIDLQGQDDDHPRFTPSTVDAVALDG